MWDKTKKICNLGDIVIFCKFVIDAQAALKRAKEILEGELKLKLSPEKTKIAPARSKGVEFLGFRFNGRYRSELDGYIRGRLRSFEAKKRNWNTILFTLPEPELRKMGWFRLLRC
ncbi:MAG: hypothetical protein J5U17_01730 [Candidatus Methanoperedens sp.]|nr:hypothetical protein [Candidatus Methanoperedens sp.]MCE8428877.1 hypothetical protein [Candidatus Methanoperedens sp.]